MSQIDRQAAVEKFEPWLKVKGYSEGERNMLKAVLYELTVMPSAQPERKRGKWINKDGGLATCSACGERWGVWSVMNYCPNCGACMKGDTT